MLYKRGPYSAEWKDEMWKDDTVSAETYCLLTVRDRRFSIRVP